MPSTGYTIEELSNEYKKYIRGRTTVWKANYTPYIKNYLLSKGVIMEDPLNTNVYTITDKAMEQGYAIKQEGGEGTSLSSSSLIIRGPYLFTNKLLSHLEIALRYSMLNNMY